jgi:arabinan endo-1,5-alpha-L-arabinosidase
MFAWGGVSAFALMGDIRIHDLSTVIKCDGTYYVYGTGRGIPFLTSTDGLTWQRGGKVFDQIPGSVKSYVPKNDGQGVWAPDVIQVNGQYYLYYAVSTWGSYVSAIGLMTSPTLNPQDPHYKWTDSGMVVHSSEGENLNAIDPGVFRAPDGTLWLCYGSFHGNIELVQLDPATGQRIKPDSKVWIIADRSEASEMIFHDGYYYLFVNHGSCCMGANSTYRICVGRSKTVTGPYLDRYGDDMAQGAGTLFVAAAGRQIGPGHFGLLVDNGVEKFSCHYEADLDKGGRSALEIRPLLWTADGWPQPGKNPSEATIPPFAPGETSHDEKYQIRSQRTGLVLHSFAKSAALVVTGSSQPPNKPVGPAVPPTSPGQLSNKPAASTVQPTAPAEPPNSVVTDEYMLRDNQQWTITPAGNGFSKIINAADGKALEAADSTADMAPFTGGDNQLWKVAAAGDGSFTIAAKSNQLALTATRQIKLGNGIALQDFTGDDTQRWAIVAP